MARKKPAAKKAAQKDYEVIGFRLTKGEKSSIEKKAEANGMTVSQWMREAGRHYQPRR